MTIPATEDPSEESESPPWAESPKAAEWLRTASYFAALLCFAALFPLPMQSFYTVFHVVVCGVSAWHAYRAYRQGKTAALIAFAAFAVLFNPIWPIEVQPLYWRAVAFVAAILLLIAAPRKDA